MRISKIHEEQVIPKTVSSFLNWRGVKATTFWDFSGKEEIRYIISGEISNWEELDKKVREAEKEKKAIQVFFVKKSLKRFVNSIQ